MRKVRYSVAVSLDGYIAGPNGEIDWIVMDPEIDFRALMAGFDTVLMGRRTFEAAARQGGGSMPGMKAIVVSSTLRPSDHPKLTIVGEGLAEAVGKLKVASGKDIWLFGGGSLLRSMLDLGLVDTIELAVIPVMLGSGTPLLPEGRRVPLALQNSRVYAKTGTVSLEYAVVRKKPARK